MYSVTFLHLRQQWKVRMTQSGRVIINSSWSLMFHWSFELFKCKLRICVFWTCVVVSSPERVELLIGGLRWTEPSQPLVLHQVSESSWVIRCITSPSTFHHHHHHHHHHHQRLCSAFTSLVSVSARLFVLRATEAERVQRAEQGGRQMNQLAGGQINTVVVWGEDARRSDGLQPSERRSEERDRQKLGRLSAWTCFHF